METSAMLSPALIKNIQRGTITAVLTVFVAALTLSWNGLTHLALNAGVSIYLAWLLPVVIDGTVIAGALVVLHASLLGTSARYGWVLTLSGAGVSVLGNLLAATATENLVGVLTHALPPLGMALSLEALMRIVRHKIVVANDAAAESEREAEKAARRAVAASRVIEKVREPKASVSSLRRIIEAQPEGASRVEKVIAVLNVYPHPAARDLTTAFGFDAGRKADVQKIYKALSTARLATEQGSPTGPVLSLVSATS